MESFVFSSEQKTSNSVSTIFNGTLFYKVYKDSDFLRVDGNVEKLLSRAYEVRQKVKEVAIGDSIIIKEMKLARGSPLIIKRAGRGVIVENFEFTCSRLQGLVAAYAYENRLRFPMLDASEAKTLGLVWNNENDEKSKLYLSAVSGTDNMIDQFSFYPFLCGLRKFQLKKIPVELVVGMGNVKNDEGITMAKLLARNAVTAKRLWSMFPSSSDGDIERVVSTTPKLKNLFEG